MDERIKRIYHNNKEILYQDFKGMSTNEIIEFLKKLTDDFIKDNKAYLFLSDYTGLHANAEYIKTATDFSKKTKHLNLKGAFLGIEGMSKFLFNNVVKATKNNYKAFDTQEEALNWLVSD